MWTSVVETPRLPQKIVVGFPIPRHQCIRRWRWAYAKLTAWGASPLKAQLRAGAYALLGDTGRFTIPGKSGVFHVLDKRKRLP